MALPNIFNPEIVAQIISRINQLDSSTNAKWGKMNVSQMLAHCCVPYEYVFEKKHKAPGFLMQFILKSFAKEGVVNEKPYPKSSPTAKDFLMTSSKDFESEKQRLIAYIQKTQALGEAYFDGKKSHSFGVLNKEEWNNMFYKHLDHHLKQFGV